MATNSPDSKNNKPKPAAAKKELLPPDEKFWQRYSPHHEFPLSATSSVFLHILVFGLIALVLSSSLFAFFREKPIEVDAIVIAGGGGNPLGVGSGPGDGVIPTGPEAAAKEKPPEVIGKDLPTEQLKKPELKPVQLTDLPSDPNAKRPIEPETHSLGKLSEVGKNAKARLEGILAGYGKGGTGSGGGKGRGTGTGEGDLSGPGKGTLGVREKRQLRWTMIFNTRSGNDYANQLNGLGAFIAILNPSGEYLVIRNLKARPVRGEIEDLRQINRIYWVDDKPQSVNSLAVALGIRSTPDHIVAFFPVDLEKELLEKEMKYFKGKEDDIEETFFKVVERGGRYETVVTEVRRRR